MRRCAPSLVVLHSAPDTRDARESVARKRESLGNGIRNVLQPLPQAAVVRRPLSPLVVETAAAYGGSDVEFFTTLDNHAEAAELHAIPTVDDNDVEVDERFAAARFSATRPGRLLSANTYLYLAQRRQMKDLSLAIVSRSRGKRL